MSFAGFSGAKTFSAIAVGVVGVLTLVSIPQLVENVDSKEITVIQSPISGELHVYTEPGLVFQGFGKVTTYPRREQFSFSAKSDQGKAQDDS